MIDHEYTAIFSDDIEETFEDFKVVLEAIREEKDGLHTLFFSRYNEYRIYTEVLYIIKNEENLIFLEYPSAIRLNVDNNLTPTSLDTILGTEIFVKTMYLNNNVEFIGDVPDYKGNMLHAYCLNNDESLQFGQYWFKNLQDQVDGIHIPEIDMVEISRAYLEFRIEKFKNNIQRVINTGEVYEGMHENPFSNDFFDHEEINL